MEEVLIQAEPADESAVAFARRLGYRARDDDRELTVRAVLIGSVFAVINGAVNMFFAFTVLFPSILNRCIDVSHDSCHGLYFHSLIITRGAQFC